MSHSWDFSPFYVNFSTWPARTRAYACISLYACIYNAHVYTVHVHAPAFYLNDHFPILIFRATSREVKFSAGGGSFSASGKRYSARPILCGCGPKKVHFSASVHTYIQSRLHRDVCTINSHSARIIMVIHYMLPDSWVHAVCCECYYSA